MPWPLLWIGLLGFGGWFGFRIWRTRTRDRWRGAVPHQLPVIFLNGGMAVRPTVLGHAVPEGYRAACAFFGVGLIDRAGVLDTGFPVEIQDPIPTGFDDVPAMDRLCADRAESLVEEARRLGKPLRLLWSGGIDSTCVAACLIDAMGPDVSQLEIAYSKQSVQEYRKFDKLLKKRGVTRRLIKTVPEALSDDALIVTGEHGDQIFGSMLAADVDFTALWRPWKEVVPSMMADKIGWPATEKALAVMEPQIAACPIRCETAYDMLWWANFSMKWQTVAHRIVAQLPDEQRSRVAPVMRHFFGTDMFQRWSLANPDGKIGDSWQSYKFPLKDIIFAFNGDRKYRADKEKERSLRGLVPAWSRRPLAMDAAGAIYSQAADRSILPREKRSAVSYSMGE